MTERPILFSAPMVRALLEGRKTQTRRIVKPPRWAHSDFELELYSDHGSPQCVAAATGCLAPIPCPYGQPGDQLWVRETWQTLADGDCLSLSEIAPGSQLQYPATYDGWVSKRRPSIFMPRWASRINLRIIEVRVQRLQEISHRDAPRGRCRV